MRTKPRFSGAPAQSRSLAMRESIEEWARVYHFEKAEKKDSFSKDDHAVQNALSRLLSIFRE